jgi:hypothetical protein
MPEGDGTALRHHLSTVERVYRRRDERLHVEPPAALGYLWEWFIELSSSRQGLVALSYSEIRAWSVLTGRRVGPEEVAILKRMDNLFLASARGNKWLAQTSPR